MYDYGVKIGEKHTYRDWGLICTKVTISDPERKSIYVTVPGRNGDIDLSEVLTDGPRYGSRTVQIDLVRIERDIAKWQMLYSDILDYCHGRRMKVILDSDPGFYYEGRIKIESAKESRGSENFSIIIDADPFKYDSQSSTEDWLWDSLNFYTGIIRQYNLIQVIGSAAIRVIGSPMPVIPTIIVSAEMKVSFEGKSYDLAIGKNRITDIYIKNQTYSMEFNGTGTVTIDYRGGRL